ncbi:hypothetical protein EXU29_09095 [Acinetobacter wuhouensis]|uniref:hypothetical protein n=1 Tax=Acinetobacter wuhouensis TaxID=1879050 RepID=UPI0010235847|nr:hypothetical protein [Acinetobacter wuhouensis]RZG72653.1 hypothetical protein EXU29_09095 [Acinetobacter wuhouensis]
MTLKSFPKVVADGQVIWFVDEKDVDSALRNNKGKEALFSLSEDLIVVQLPLSRLRKVRSPQLAQLEKNGLAKKDCVLVMCRDLKVESKYVELETLLEDFLAYNLRKANGYSRFFAALGATSFEFKHENNEISEFSMELDAKIDGLASKITALDGSLKGNIKNTLKQIASINKNYKQYSFDTTERIEKAEKILKECGLEHDEICKDTLNTAKDGLAMLTAYSLTMSNSSYKSKKLQTVLNMGLKIPNLSDADSKQNASLISLKSKMEVAALVSDSFEFTLNINFQ